MIGAAAALDSWRAGILRRTLRFGPARRIFLDRSIRTPLWFTLSLILNVFLVWRFPALSFYAVPLILGVPHLLASFRYGWRESGAWGIYVGITLAFAWAVRSGASQSWAFMTVVLTLFSMNGRGMRVRAVPAGILLVALAFGFYRDPYLSALALSILHNFVAFLFWFRSARNTHERWGVAYALLLTFLAVSAVPFLPVIESLGEISWNLAGLEADFFGVAFVRIFLLTQSLHYFIWLKAIPDQHAPTEIPVSFRSGFREDRQWFGRSIHVGVLVLVAGLLIWAYGADRELARRAYVQLAAYHGFAELAFLAGVMRRGGA
jgi:hypothetical protein